MSLFWRTSWVLVLSTACFVLAGCFDGNQVEHATSVAAQEQELSDEEVNAIISQLLFGNTVKFEALRPTQREQVIRLIIEQRIYPDRSVDPTIGEVSFTGKSMLTLPDCGGYWTTWWEYERIEQRNTTNGLLYQVGPNCCMRAPGDDCGTDHDDYMLSFYFGRHDESISELRPKLKWYSTSWWVRLLLGNLSARVYQQTPETGADNYDVKICIDDYFYRYFETFRLRKY